MLKHSLRRRLLIFTLLMSITPLVFMGYFGYSNTEKTIIEKEEEKINFFLNNIRGKIVKFFSNTKGDLLFLKGVTEDSLFYSNDNISDIDKKELENIYYHFSKNNKQYAQIRFIDKDGYEIIRINNNGDNAYIVSNDKLQYKGCSYYYQEALTLKNGEIYISQLDLNRENGKIEIQLKPMVRYITPVYIDSDLKGYIVLNLNIQYLFKDIEILKNQNGYENTIILDSEGYYLLHPNKEKEWGSEVDLNTRENFKADYKEISKEILMSKEMKIKSVGQNILAWNPVKIIGLDSRKMIIFLKIAKNNYLQPLIDFRNLFIIELIFITLVMIAIAIIISFYITKPILKIVNAVENIGKGEFDVELDINTGDELELLGYEIKKMSFQLKNMYRNMEALVDERTKELKLAHREMEIMATRDSLTGLYNRHYFNQYIQSIADDIKNNYKNMMVLIIDIDKFKYINDNYGHNIGDIILKAVANLLKNSAREKDITVRYGGDEFLVILNNSTKVGAEKYIQRVEESLDEWNINSDILKHQLTLSIGYDEYSSGKHIIEVINNADKMMYENKVYKSQK
ncbi:diguanylate cyclase [Paramaledivibacter caminithermalis]|uniref:Diguanylate cyclase (GGDEF) domain-containing protein n=1 Tax=Paramaledivibacter caminithermalis (strain DSM 15212 / CIP 107654 / DViRD3) TaxID=1121301 RepID=A0A1M6PRX6_PARC5|nr:diguanylate cyclase [Paramaledivibacter caminithermalis]SHK10686.1 diguanylate cyclase (GGDEF) domain-containing protein [Paramaledivibacter caminithermalis DSM 15212]